MHRLINVVCSFVRWFNFKKLIKKAAYKQYLKKYINNHKKENIFLSKMLNCIKLNFKKWRKLLFKINLCDFMFNQILAEIKHQNNIEKEIKCCLSFYLLHIEFWSCYVLLSLFACVCVKNLFRFYWFKYCISKK